MPSWNAYKDPDAVLDYVYTIPLDTGDTVTAHTFERVSGTVVIDDESRAGADITADLSGGVAGEISIFKVTWTTAGGREDEDYVSLYVIEKSEVPLALTGYAKPNAHHLIARYPAFADVSVATIATWMVDAERFVGENWSEGDYAAALMAKAAHEMTLLGLGAATGAGAIPAGVTRFKSASVDITVSDAAAGAQAKGGYGATLYGREFQRLLRRNFTGMGTVATGVAPNGESSLSITA